MYTAFDIIMIPLQLLIIFFTLYYFFVSWFGLFGKKKEVKIYNESKTFALIACAHNEERVIAQLVDNLRRLNYNDALCCCGQLLGQNRGGCTQGRRAGA